MPTARGGDVTIRDLSKSFALGGRQLAVLRSLNLDIRSGECLVIVGASGSGKTTLLRILAGLERADGGAVAIDGKRIEGVGEERAVIFQEPRLLPWLTVLGNVAFGLEVRGIAKAEAEKRARFYVALVGLAEFSDAYPRQLSGGMAQRVGIARALTVQPEILLLDEPLGALDAMTKISMQEELARIWSEENVTMVMVTHDLEEAIYLADRVLILPREKGGAARLIDVNLPRPRERSESRFVRYREELLREFGLH
ncbi:ABC transporter ATP-binding protein [Mesorhizobium sp. CA18]|uniref:ABC transporter ATP-binding protein n=1 Tax=unclassified Mesorhizobium TaxID=325217 RepID=UPI001CCA8710|nr:MULTISPECIES: ABC transporter ATP-binding protein [unclassified Mesorhizobium]MBZ9733007.1 ABC transporter ATP-binding protein [Mesorhizobium sp. CA9]MBZ9827952.1 ABC transporter ATP-binding protein [Mesorhizobium sp. CA18]MBZ9830657.1 ABC transporter ATP-binding protein [Mesorhizobium sp. CA2]MBZ9836345.1 ABC transporter ATP-binding protein [Mesorhizobium sp. CA3]MBZ9876355.1 ABC transporter ATP-binding protein [Mesorhizobium sp. Ca11]